MAPTNVPLSAFVPNGNLADPAGTAIDVTNGMEVAADGRTDLIVLRITNTAGSAKVVTIPAGSDPPAGGALGGALTQSIALTSGVNWLGPFESRRFVGAAGKLQITFVSGHTGTVTAFKLPKAV
jgi:hypothetical protein